eukprot:3177794-Rhodomonas_salina.1
MNKRSGGWVVIPIKYVEKSDNEGDRGRERVQQGYEMLEGGFEGCGNIWCKCFVTPLYYCGVKRKQNQ